MGGCEVLLLLQLEKITIYLERKGLQLVSIGESSLGLLAFKMCLKGWAEFY